jgi:P27 family predicted phage terminase small subunit
MKRGPVPGVGAWAPPEDAVKAKPRAPAFLGKYGKAMYKTVTEALVPLGLLGARDLPGLELSCSAYNVARECLEAVAFEVDANGKKRRRNLSVYLAGKTSQNIPELTNATKLLTAARGLLAEYGLTPASRSRIGAPIEQPYRPKDDMEGLLEAD